MQEIQMSGLLLKLMASSKSIGNTQKPPFTAERFILAIMNSTIFGAR